MRKFSRLEVFALSSGKNETHKQALRALEKKREECLNDNESNNHHNRI